MSTCKIKCADSFVQLLTSFVFCGALVLCTGSEYDKETLTSEEIVQRIDTYIKAGLACHNNPGLAVSVVRNGEVFLAKGYGYKTTEQTEPVTNTTVFGMASLSKAFAATLILKLIEESKGRISLSSTVRSVLDNDELFYGYLRSRYTTLEDLLAHRMGVPGNNQLRLDDTLTRKSLTERLKYLRAVGGFRTSFYYSNLMYGLVTYIGEVLGGTSWEELVKSKLYDPLGMTSSTFTTTADPEQIDLAKGYIDLDGDLIPVPFELSKHWGMLCGSGCVMSTALDMARWMMFNLEGGRNKQGRQILETASLEHALKPQNSMTQKTQEKFYTRPATPVTLSLNNYGFGWKLGHYRGYPVRKHSGSTYGYRSLLTLLPNVNIGVFVTMTGDDPSMLFRTNLHLYIADLMLGYKPWLNTSTICTFPEPWNEPDAKKPTPEVRKDLTAHRKLEDYSGVFSNPAYGTLNISVNSISNLLVLHYGFGVFNLYPKSEKDEFYAEGAGLLANLGRSFTLEFEENKKEGSIDSFSVPAFESKMPPKFVKKKSTASVSSNHKHNDANCVITDSFVMACLLMGYWIVSSVQVI